MLHFEIVNGKQGAGDAIPVVEIVLGIGGFVAVFFSVLFRDETFVLRDLLSFHRPLAEILVRLGMEGSGRLLWNPYLADGQPFAANPNSLAHHPLSLLFQFLPFEWAFRSLILAPILAAGVSMFCLLLSLGRSRAASVFGGAAWMLSGAVLSSANLLPSLLTLAPLPAVAGLARLVVQGRSRTAPGWLALIFGLELAAGEPALLLATIAVIAAALVAPSLPDTNATIPRPSLRGMIRLLLPFALGLLLGAATLLPAAALARRTVRAEPGGLSAAEAGSWSFPPVRLAELLTPRAFGDAEKDRDEPGWYFGGALYPDKEAPYVVSIYGGLLVLLLAVTAFRRRLREELPWLLVFLGGVLMAAGNHTPLFGLLRWLIPPMAILRYPERFVLVALLALVPPASRGFDLVVNDEESRRTFRRLLIACAAASLLVAIGLAVIPVLAGADCWAQLGLVPGRIASAVAQQLPVDALRPALIALGALAVLRLCNGARRKWLPILLQVLVVVDLAAVGQSLIATRPVKEVLAPPEPLATLAAASLEGPLFHAAALDRRRGYAVRLAPPPEPALWKIATTLDPDFDRAQLRWTSRGSERVRGAIESYPVLAGPLLARRGTAAVLTFRGEHGDRVHPLRLELLRPVDRRPFVFVADRVETIESDRDWLNTVRRLGPIAARTAIVERTELSGLPTGYGSGRVESFDAKPGSIRAVVQVDSGPWVLLAVNQSWDVGWHASVDGSAAVPVRRIDLSLIGVPLMPGRHEVVIAYDDPWDQRGRIASRVGLAGGLLLLLALQRRRA